MMLVKDLRSTAYRSRWRWCRRRLNFLRFCRTDKQRSGEDDTGEGGDNALTVAHSWLAAIPVDTVARSARVQRKGYRVIRAVSTLLTLILRCVTHFRLTFMFD